MTEPRDRKESHHGHGRNFHRSRSHDSAHAQDQEKADHEFKHQSVVRGPAKFIATQSGLNGLMEKLKAAGRFAYDSEFIGELTYFPKLCLIQTATESEIALIDPLAELDLTSFWDLICDAHVQKVVHAGQQDIEPVIRHRHCPAANVFDTQIAAGFIELPYPVSLSKLVLELTGARLGKGLTFTHWDQRPLSEMQLRYAANDVRFLLLVQDELVNRLKANGHLPWALQECEAQCSPSLYGFDPDSDYLRIRGAASLSGRNLAVLRELAIWRDEGARSHNLPPRTFLRDEVLLDLARNPIKEVEKLQRVRGLPRAVEHADGAAIVEATQRALAMSESALPASREIEFTPKEKFKADALWAAAQCHCFGQSIDPALVASRQEVGELFRRLAAGEETARLRLMTGWRRDALGEPLTQLIRGQQQIDLSWSNDALRVKKPPSQ